MHGHGSEAPISAPIVGTHPRCASTLSAYRNVTTRARGWREAQRLAGLPSRETIEDMTSILQSDVCEATDPT